MTGLELVAIALGLVLGQTEEDIDAVDRPEKTAKEAEAEALEARFNISIPYQDELRLARGDTLFIRAEVPVRQKTRGALTAQIRDIDTGRGLVILSRLESSLPAPNGRSVQVQYIVRGLPDAPIGTLTAKLSLVVRDERRVVATRPIRQRFVIESASPSKTSIELDRKTYLHYDGRAERIFAGLPPEWQAKVRSEKTPDPSEISDPALRSSMIQLSAHQLRRDIAHQRLRAAAGVSDDELVETAVLAIGSLPRPRSASDRARQAKGGPQNLAAARTALLDLRFDEAESILNVVRKSGKLEIANLAKTLQLLGAVHAARGRTEEAVKHFGQASCLDPTLGAPIDRPPMKRIFEEVRHAAGCSTRLELQGIHATRRTHDGQLVVDIQAEFGPDPYRLVSGGDIELWGSGGEIIEVAQVRASHGTTNQLEARFEDRGDLENFGGQLLIRLTAKEVSGVVIAEIGAADPVAVPIEDATPALTPSKLPWWIWVAGGAVVAGAAVTATALIVSGEDVRGIGPISASF